MTTQTQSSLYTDKATKLTKLRLFAVASLLCMPMLLFISCGPPPNEKTSSTNQINYSTNRKALTLPVKISDLPTSVHATFFLPPRSQASKNAWPHQQKWINCLTEWVADRRTAEQSKLISRPFFYRAACPYSSDEVWTVLSRVASPDIALMMYGDYFYDTRPRRKYINHDGDDWNCSKANGNSCDQDSPPLASICDGKVISVQSESQSGGWGNQIHILCKFAAPWRTIKEGALVEGYEFIVVKYAHLSQLPSQKAGDTVNAGETIGKVGTTGASSGTHLHISFMKETLLTLCDSNAGKNSADYICLKNGVKTQFLGNFTKLRDNYYDPIEFLKARSGTLLYSKRYWSSQKEVFDGRSAMVARSIDLTAPSAAKSFTSNLTVVIELRNRDYPLSANSIVSSFTSSSFRGKAPPETRITVEGKNGIIYAGAEDWSARDRRAVIRNIAPGSQLIIKVKTRNRSDSYTTLTNAAYQFTVTAFENSSAILGDYGKSNYPRLATRSGLPSDIGILYTDKDIGRKSQADKNRLNTLFQYLKVGYDQSFIPCKEDRYNCDYNRSLTKCEVAKALTVFMNWSFPASKFSPFTDLSSSDDCYQYATIMWYNGIAGAKEPNKPQAFNGKKPINRATAITMLVRAINGHPQIKTASYPTSFIDVRSTDWFAPYILWAHKNRLVYGCAKNKICVNSPVTAAELTIMLVRFMGFNDKDGFVYSQSFSGLVQQSATGGGNACSGCTCGQGDQQPCGSDTGACQMGYYACVNGQWDTSTCHGEIKPSPEICNGIDDDCDGQVDNLNGSKDPVSEPCELPDCGTKGKRLCINGKLQGCDAKPCTSGKDCIDKDGDGYGEGKDCIAKDCDDNDPNIHPGQVEICNRKDDDCDGYIDQVGNSSALSFPCSSSPCGNRGTMSCSPNGTLNSCSAAPCPKPCEDKDNDGYFSAESGPHCPGSRDCNDSDPKINPTATETCNGLDDDCDGHIDNQTINQSEPLVMYCRKPPCMDRIPIKCLKGTWELCKLQNCPACLDRDQDGAKTGGLHCQPQDCDDTDSNIKSGSKELCNNKDDDCDGRIDNPKGSDQRLGEQCTLSCGANGMRYCKSGFWTACEGSCNPCQDQDGDGYKTGGLHCGLPDCNDNPKDPDAKSIYPTATEKCNGLDDDCDGFIDNVITTNKPLKKFCLSSICSSRSEQICKNGQWSACSALCKCEDKDQDGFKVGDSHCGKPDCDDNDPNRSPLTPETCNGKDDNCNGQVDENLTCNCQAGDTKSCYKGDSTKINIGRCRAGKRTCIENQFGTSWGLCKGSILPTPEKCNTPEDDNCDGQVNENCVCIPLSHKSCGSSVGECKSGRITCDQNTHQWGPCIGSVGPKAEICDGKDNDCDGLVDESLTKPCHSFPASKLNIGLCKAGYSICSQGKWDNCLSEIKPSPEVCDNADNDCNGKIDDNVPPRQCYTGPPGTKGVGTCKQGAQTCTAGKWNPCQGDIHPKTEVCDGKDNDCNGFIDNKPGGNQLISRPCTRKPCNFQGLEICTAGKYSTCTASQCPQQNNCKDSDGDGYPAYDKTLCPTGTDCNDSDSNIHPGKLEVCDGKDNNCDGKTDLTPTGQPIIDPCYINCPNGSPVAGRRTCDPKASQWSTCQPKAPCPQCIDKDNDGYGVNGATDCRNPGKKDCDDSNAQINPAAQDNQCDGKDNDCDGQIDNQSGTSSPLTGNCLVSPCNKPGTRTCTKGQWSQCTSTTPCEYCGNGFCSNTNENCKTCPQDCKCPSGQYCNTGLERCVPTCGNGQVDPGENCRTCSVDVKCPTGKTCNTTGQCETKCGNGKIDWGEDCTNCPVDVKCINGRVCQSGNCVMPTEPCGNGICRNGENCSTCQSDCGCSTGYTCDSGTCKQTTQVTCGDQKCQSGETSSNCCIDCGCPSGQSCIQKTCTSTPPTCNCSSHEYCDNGTCKPYFTISGSTACNTVNKVTICISGSSKNCNSSGCRFELSRSSGTWSGNEMYLIMKNQFNQPRNCWATYTIKSSEVPAGSSGSVPLNLSLSCLQAGESAVFQGTLYSPSTCRSATCEFMTGNLTFTRNK